MRSAGSKVVAVCCAVALVAGCSKSGGPSSSNGGGSNGGTAVAGAPQTLTGNELRYGASPSANGPITFQPDVVLLGGGADSVRSVSADGLIWTIDGHAAHADELTPGKVLFATSFGAGRVLAVDQVGADERVALGPVALTDIIKDGTLRTDTPVALTGFEAYSTPTQPGLDTPLAPASQSSTASFPPVRLVARVSKTPPRWTAVPMNTPLPSVPGVSLPGISVPGAGGPGAGAAGGSGPGAGLPALPPLPAPSPNIPDSAIGSWNVQSVCCTSIGVHVSYDKNGARVQGTASLRFDKPSVTFDVSVSGGHVVNASAKLIGAAGISFGISAAVEASSSDFHGGRIQLPVDIAIPIPVGNIPVTIGISQIFSVSLGLSGKAALSTTGEYALGGSLGFSLRNGSPTIDTPTLETTKSALDSVQSIAVAPSALTFSYAVKTSIGIGPPGLNAGIWYQVAASLGLATSGSQIDQLQGTSLVTCKTVSLDLEGRYGVGYHIPSLVAQAINLFLRAVMKNPPRPIDPSGGPQWGPTNLYHKSTPPCSK